MRRGCIITIIILAVIALVGSIFIFLFVWPKVKQSGTSSFAYVIEDGLEQYKADEKQYPPTSVNAEIMKILLGDNPRKKVYVQNLDPVIRDGQMTDFWKNPFNFEMPAEGSDAKPKVTSAGPNGIHGDADDIGSAFINSKFEADKE